MTPRQLDVMMQSLAREARARVGDAEGGEVGKEEIESSSEQDASGLDITALDGLIGAGGGDWIKRVKGLGGSRDNAQAIRKL